MKARWTSQKGTRTRFMNGEARVCGVDAIASVDWRRQECEALMSFSNRFLFSHVGLGPEELCSLRVASFGHVSGVVHGAVLLTSQEPLREIRHAKQATVFAPYSVWEKQQASGTGTHLSGENSRLLSPERGRNPVTERPKIA